MKFRLITWSVLLMGAGCGLFGAPVSAATTISELYYDASGSDSGLAFVELFGTPGESLDGLLLEGINGGSGAIYSVFTLHGVMPADGIMVIGDDAGGGVTLVPGADAVGDVDYQNGPDSVVLRDLTSVLDAVGYGSFTGGDIFAGEGAPAPDAAAGSSIARANPLLDSNDNSVDFLVLANPTPGSVPVVSSVPLPATVWLFGSGLLGVLSVGKRRCFST